MIPLGFSVEELNEKLETLLTTRGKSKLIDEQFVSSIKGLAFDAIQGLDNLTPSQRQLVTLKVHLLARSFNVGHREVSLAYLDEISRLVEFIVMQHKVVRALARGAKFLESQIKRGPA